MDARRILGLICCFNVCPADYVHPTRRSEAVGMDLAPALWDCPSARRHLSRRIVARLGPHEAVVDSAWPGWSLALMEAPRLERLAQFVAAALVGAAVRCSLSRDDVLRWRQWLTPETHAFAVTACGLLPLAGTFSPPPGLGAGEVGQACLESVSRAWPEAVRRRFALKLPAAVRGHPGCTVSPEDAQRALRFVLPLVEANWCSLFAARIR